MIIEILPSLMRRPGEKIKALPFTLERGFFNQIRSGSKKTEYREIKPYWTKRLRNPDGTFRDYTHALFSPGYSRDPCLLLVEIREIWEGIPPIPFMRGKECYCIELGEVREIHPGDFRIRKEGS